MCVNKNLLFLTTAFKKAEEIDILHPTTLFIEDLGTLHFNFPNQRFLFS